MTAAFSRVALLPLRGEHSAMMETMLRMYRAHLERTPDPLQPTLLAALDDMQKGFEAAITQQVPAAAERPWMFAVT